MKFATRATLCAIAAAIAAVVLLAVSGWFIVGCALAGAAGLAAAQAYNVMLPSACVRLMAIIRTAGRHGERVWGHHDALLASAQLRPALFHAIASRPAPQALAVSAGKAATTMAADVTHLEFRRINRHVQAGSLAAAAAGLVFVASVNALAGMALLVILLSGGLLARLTAARLRRTMAAAHEATSALKDELSTLSAADVELRCLALEDWARERAWARNEELLHAQQRSVNIESGFQAALAASSGVAAVLVLGLSTGAGAPLAALAGLAALMAVETAAPGWRAQLQQPALADAAARVAALQAPTITAAPLEPAAATGASTISLSPRERVAIVGPSGSGKTTLIETLLGLRPADPGLPRIEALDATWAWLPQDATLIAGTVRDNLLMGLPSHDGESAADDEPLWQALRDAALDERVATMPNGLDTWIGQDGALLSGGERRRLALARAYLFRADYLLLDEPTEALDSATESLVLERLSQRIARTGQGLLAVTHRPAVLALCTQTLVVGKA